MTASGGSGREQLPPEVLDLVMKQLSQQVPSLDTVRRVSALLQAGRADEAARAARDALATDPDDVVLLNLLTRALLDSDQHREALTVAERAVARAPDDVTAVRNLGYATYKNGKAEQAEEILGRALALRPDDLMARVMLGDVLLRQASARFTTKGRQIELLTRADRVGSELVRDHPDNAIGYLIQGKVAVGRNDPTRASALARQALAIEPDNSLGHQVLGLAAQQAGDTRAAADHFVSSGRIDPGGGATRLLRQLRGGPVLGVIAGIIVTRIALRAGAAVGGAVAAVVFVAVLWAILWYYPRWKARRSMSPEARAIYERTRKLRR